MDGYCVVNCKDFFSDFDQIIDDSFKSKNKLIKIKSSNKDTDFINQIQDLKARFNFDQDEQGVNKDSITIVRCPGSYEIPLTAQWLLETKRYDGVIALGVVIRGVTPHFKYVCNAVNRGVIDLNLRFSTPVAFGVLTTDNVQQALDRVGDKGNKGSEAALALLEMIAIRQNLK